MTTMHAQAALHDAYAAEYDDQVRAYECYLAEALFGLCYEYARPGESLLDVGIGSGLSAAPFAKAGLRVSGMDFSAAMLDLCRAKGIAGALHVHDVMELPWPFPPDAFDHVIACGLLHFIPDLEAIFDEVARVIRPDGLFAFTTKSPAPPAASPTTHETQSEPGLDIYEHYPAFVEMLVAAAGFDRLKTLRCFVGDDIFCAWVVQKRRE